MNNISQTTHYGNTQKEHVDCFFLNLHADLGVDFFNLNPDILSAVEDVDIFEKYIALEADIGTRELSHIAARQLISTHNDLHVAVFDAQIPRGVLDIGRWTAERAIRPIIEYSKHPNIYEELKKKHEIAILNLKHALDTLSDTGIWIDIHSMSPFNPDPTRADNSGPDPIKPTPATLSEYINVYTSLDNQGIRRRINLATHTIEDPEIQLVDGRLLKSAQNVLNRARFDHAADDPHPMSDAITAAQLMKKYGRGLFIDVPKDFISDYPATWTAEYLTKLDISHPKTQNLSSSISSIAHNALSMTDCTS